jgi:hypothetical protein
MLPADSERPLGARKTFATAGAGPRLTLLRSIIKAGIVADLFKQLDELDAMVARGTISHLSHR